MKALFGVRESRDIFSKEVTLERILKDAFIYLYVKGTYLTRPISSFKSQFKWHCYSWEFSICSV